MTNFFNRVFVNNRRWAVVFRPCLCLAAAVLALTACDTDTVDFGSLDKVEDVVSGTDQIVVTTMTFDAQSGSAAAGALRSSNHKSYFGHVTDPETGAVVKAEYVTQLHTFEGVIFPESDSLTVKEDGLAVCDSVELLMYYNTWYGDKSMPLKLNVVPLRTDKILPEDSVFYSDVNLHDYAVTSNDGRYSVLASKVFTPWDYTLSESELNSATHTHCTRVRLPREFGNKIMRRYYESPADFKDTYAFVHNVCPGFYMQLAAGDGAMVEVSSTSLNIYYRFNQHVNGKDSIFNAYTNFVGSAEVVQATNFSIENINHLVREDVDTTYLISPAGLRTEVRLPVKDIFKGHDTDSLTRVQMTMMRYNPVVKSDFGFAAPTTLAMIPKCEIDRFFEKGYTLESRKFATAAFSSSFNCYDFSNVARLVSYLNSRKPAGMTEQEELQWEADNAGWDTVVLVPVSVTTNAANNTVVSIKHDMSVSSACLVGGRKPIDVNVTYSRYK